MKEQVIDTIYPEDMDLRLVSSLDGPEFGFVLKTFTQSAHKQYPNNFMPNSIFFPKQNKILRSVISNGAKLLFSTIKGSPDDYFGYMIADDRIPGYLIVHWVHVKSNWQNMTVAKQLLEFFNYKDKQIIATNHCNNFGDLVEKYKLIFNPYLWAELT